MCNSGRSERPHQWQAEERKQGGSVAEVRVRTGVLSL